MTDYSTFTDKHKVKRIVSRTIATAREYAYFETPEQVDAFKWETLPPTFVIKSATLRKHVIIKTEKDKFNIPDAVAKIKTWLKSGGVLIERHLGDKIKEYKLNYVDGVFQSIECNGVLNPKPTNLTQIIEKGDVLIKLIPELTNVNVEIFNREMKTCCKTINDLFFAGYEFITL